MDTSTIARLVHEFRDRIRVPEGTFPPGKTPRQNIAFVGSVHARAAFAIATRRRTLQVRAVILGTVALLLATSQFTRAEISTVQKCSCAERVLYLDSQALESRKRHDLVRSSLLYERAADLRLNCLKSRTIEGHRADVMLQAADDYTDAGIDAHFGENPTREVRLLKKSVVLAIKVLLPDPTKSSVAEHILEADMSRLHGQWGPASLQYDDLPVWPKVKVCT